MTHPSPAILEPSVPDSRDAPINAGEALVVYDFLGVPWARDRRGHQVWCIASWVLALALVVLSIALVGGW